ncbi:hypothetical protein SELMODRAFT_421511 [Selaginella moellendorffii]|uniref:LysM domain-containing protein n=1 Tax=Selaginella moellendorffii TaxID=88036 RepID=D8SFI2_SELML|nr:uncharacterized protein LOC9635616 [Selaginella moellendorffii]XP_024527102.1 uncharacterized protein LOC112345151 [Selaginella moellendorffii]EFJ16844.1 hypothetical protein SELMODRAFT_421511 [Selaginella moellendorffii]|eukprot:XP_002982176.1 uncharacterized protein LOC9635616 [Selaginella moellendorffii]
MQARVAHLGAGLAGASTAVDRGISRLPSLAISVPIGRRRENAGKISAVADKAGEATDRSVTHPVSFSICHNVQEGETLTSIARQYSTSVQTIALANKIDDIDLLQTGRVLLVPVQPRVFQKVAALVIQDTPSTSEEIISTVAQPRSPVPPWMVSGFPNFVSFTAPLLLLVPVVLLGFRKLLQEAQNRIKVEVSRTQAEKELWDVQRRPRLHRWQRILDGDRESEVAVPGDGQRLEGAESETEEQRKAREEEELRKSYAELEATYMQFLADSGLSRSGYWRGGMPSSSHHDG